MNFKIVEPGPFAQSSEIDVRLQKIAAEKNDDKRIDLINALLSNTAEINPISAMQNAQTILLYSQKNKDRITEALALSEIGYNYRAFGNTEKSLGYSLKAMVLATQTGNEKLIANTELNLAHNYKDQADYSKALNLYLSVAASGSRMKDELLQCWAFSSLGQVFMAMDKMDSALMYSQRAYEICIRNHFADFLSNVLGNLGSIHGKMGNSMLAVSYFKMALKEAYRINSIRWINESFTALAQFYHDGNQNDSSVVYARKAVAVVENTVFSNKNIYAAKLLLDIYENTNSDSAIKYFKIYKAANDSLFSAKTIQQTQAMTFEDDLRQQELTAEKIKAEEERKRNTQYAAIAVGLILFTSLFLLLSRSIVVNEKWISFLGILGLLIVFEFINLFFHPYIEKITNHSPVWMLAILVAIAALLIPFHHRLEHWIKHKLVEKNKKIRLAAAKKTIEQLEKSNS